MVVSTCDYLSHKARRSLQVSEKFLNLRDGEDNGEFGAALGAYGVVQNTNLNM